MLEKHYDRAAQDTGNVVNLGHVNVCIDDQHLSTHYYVTGLGLTRDPYLNTGARNMWINVGMSQFHLPMGTPEQLRGVIGLVIPDREALLKRLARVRKALEGTRFDYRESNDCVETVCPWGNRINVHTPDLDQFGRIQLGVPYVRFDVRPGTVDRTFISVRPTRRNSPTTGITCKSISRIFPVRIAVSRNSASSPPKRANTNTASRTSSISIPAKCCSPSSTRRAARPIRCMAARWSIAIRRRPIWTTSRATTACPGRCRKCAVRW
jgi:hypothetical protein